MSLCHDLWSFQNYFYFQSFPKKVVFINDENFDAEMFYIHLNVKIVSKIYNCLYFYHLPITLEWFYAETIIIVTVLLLQALLLSHFIITRVCQIRQAYYYSVDWLHNITREIPKFFGTKCFYFFQDDIMSLHRMFMARRHLYARAYHESIAKVIEIM